MYVSVWIVYRNRGIYRARGTYGNSKWFIRFEMSLFSYLSTADHDLLTRRYTVYTTLLKNDVILSYISGILFRYLYQTVSYFFFFKDTITYSLRISTVFRLCINVYFLFTIQHIERLCFQRFSIGNQCAKKHVNMVTIQLRTVLIDSTQLYLKIS